MSFHAKQEGINECLTSSKMAKEKDEEWYEVRRYICSKIWISAKEMDEETIKLCTIKR